MTGSGIKALFGLVMGVLPGAALADQDVQNTRYSCDRGVEIQAVYAQTADGAIAVLVVEGRQILLYSEPAASGVRYGWPSDGSNYVWLTKDSGAMLLWHDGATQTETTLYSACTQN